MGRKLNDPKKLSGGSQMSHASVDVSLQSLSTVLSIVLLLEIKMRVKKMERKRA